MLSVREAAKVVNVEQQTIRNYIRNGVGNPKERLRAIQVKHGLRTEYRIKQQDLEDFRKKYLI